jgi:hypothetical protein
MDEKNTNLRSFGTKTRSNGPLETVVMNEVNKSRRIFGCLKEQRPKKIIYKSAIKPELIHPGLSFLEGETQTHHDRPHEIQVGALTFLASLSFCPRGHMSAEGVSSHWSTFYVVFFSPFHANGAKYYNRYMIMHVHIPSNERQWVQNSGNVSRVLYEGVSKSFRTDRLERELQMVKLSAIKCSCIATLQVSLVSFAATTLCVASHRVFIFISLSTQSGNFWIQPSLRSELFALDFHPCILCILVGVIVNTDT